MKPEPIITSSRNPLIVEARKLAQRKHRQQQGQFLVEGLQLLHMALDAGARPADVFYCPEQLVGAEATALLSRFRQAGGQAIAVSPMVMESLCERDAMQGIVATFDLFEASLSDLKLSGRKLVVVLDRLQDPGNLGTLIRTADAVGAAGMVLIEPCVDPFDPKTVRGTMGSLFNLPVVRTSDIHALFKHVKQCGLHVIGTDVQGGIAWGHGRLKGGVALVLGNEARGLSEDIRALIDQNACLPMVGKAESLNVAVAGGVLMYAWLRENET